MHFWANGNIKKKILTFSVEALLIRSSFTQFEASLSVFVSLLTVIATIHPYSDVLFARIQSCIMHMLCSCIEFTKEFFTSYKFGFDYIPIWVCCTKGRRSAGNTTSVSRARSSTSSAPPGSSSTSRDRSAIFR